MMKEDIIISEARRFYNYGDWKNSRVFPTAQDLIDELKMELRNHLDDDSKKVYLNELIRLIDIDAQKHLKACKKKDNPLECLEYSLYAKSKYYASQIIESINERHVFFNKQFNADKNLSDETLEAIEELIRGEPYRLFKCSPQESSEVVKRLNTLGILSKEKHVFSVHHRDIKYLKKLIELKSWKSFNDWLDTVKSEDNQTSKTSTKTSSLMKLSWIAGIIVAAIVIYEFIVKQWIK